MDTITSKISIVILSLFAIIVVARQMLVFFDEGLKTETAMPYSSTQNVSVDAVFVRDEEIVYADVNGVLSYPNIDGSKLANGSVIAYVYGSEQDIYNNYLIDKLEEEIALLEKQQSAGTVSVAQPEFISKLIDEKYSTITSLATKNELDKLSKERKEFQSLLGIYQIITNKESDYNTKISELENEITMLEANVSAPSSEIICSKSGYFVSYVDGYESVYNTDNIHEITYNEISSTVENEGIYPEKIPANAVGKIIDDYNTNIIGIIDISDTQYKVGSTVDIKISSSPDLISAEIASLVSTETENNYIITLTCDELNYSLVQNRTERIEIILNDFEGLKIPREAVRFNDKNEIGVYTLFGERVEFKKIDVIFETNDFYITSYNSDDDYVSIYDDIIVEGKIDTEHLNSITQAETALETLDINTEAA